MILLYIFLVIALVTPIVLHAPLFKISDVQRLEIKENGLIHFADPKNTNSIMNEGLKGEISHMGGVERLFGKLVWTYQFGNTTHINKMHDYVVNKKRGKDEKDRYKVCLKLSGLMDKDLDNLYRRIGFHGDSAIVYRGECLKPKTTEIIATWETTDY